MPASGRTLPSGFFDTSKNAGEPDDRFVSTPNQGLDIVQEFRIGRFDHDTPSFKGPVLGYDLAQVLADTHQVRRVGAVAVDPTAGHAVRLGGVTKAALARRPGDTAFHA